jgi:hypothetical protein
LRRLYISGGKGRSALKADNLTAIYEPIVLKMWEPRRLTTVWVSTALTGIALTFFFTTLYGSWPLLWRFRNSKFFQGGFVHPTPNPPAWNTRDYTSFGPSILICLGWMALPEAYAPASIALQVIGMRKPLPDKAGLPSLLPLAWRMMWWAGHVSRVRKLTNGVLTSTEQATWLTWAQTGKNRIVGKFNVKSWRELNCHRMPFY